MEMLESTIAPELVDAGARRDALDLARSFIVQAPAGSGKTELLIRRFLALLGTVDEPEEVLALTFTRAATAEMRIRIQEALAAAAISRDLPAAALPHGDISDQLHTLASAALGQSERRGWKLLEQPQRLNIQTIDSLALSIAHQTPLLSRLGGRLSPVEDADPLYTIAARRTIEQLGGPNVPLSAALAQVLQVRDTSLADCERLIAGMLAQRDQWLPFFSFALSPDPDWSSVRAALEEPLQREHDRVLGIARGLLLQHPGMAEELLALARYACENESKADLWLLRGVFKLQDLATAAHWKCLSHLLLTGKPKSWRRHINKSHGFPTTGRPQRERMQWALTQLANVDGLREVLCVIDSLPPTRFDDAQWSLLQHIFLILLHAVAELQIVFAERGEIDFAEAGIAARRALDDSGGTETAGRLSESIRHILVDEFQDTSRPQYDLILRLLNEWQPGDGRTCFLVGDPMQSIYLFRQAEVELFEEAKAHGLRREGALPWPLEFLELETNFRSIPEIVEPLNTLFSTIFSTSSSHAGSAIAFARSTSSQAGSGQTISPENRAKRAVHVHAAFVRRSDPPERAQELRQREAQQVLACVEQHRGTIEAAENAQTPYRVAVLVRSKSHLLLIAGQLRHAGVRFRSVEIETLRQRQEILDLVALVRALTHPMDRIAWLSVLRSPWCGLDLRDLHAVCGDELSRNRQQPMLTLLRERIAALSESGRHRALRVLAVLEASLGARTAGILGASPAALSLWVERTWEGLGGRLCLDAEEQENAEVFFRMLAQLPPDGISLRDEGFEHSLDRLFARPDPLASERYGVQLMTIHKSKGLGFDAVIVPALERSVARDSSPLLCWMARKRPGSARQELLLAPIGRKGQGRSPLYSWVERQKQQGTREEQKRLLYVACSRARSELHLFGTARVRHAHNTATGASLSAGDSTSLLATAWPGLRQSFEASWREEITMADAAGGHADNAGAASNLLQMPIPHSESSILPRIAASTMQGEAELFPQLSQQHAPRPQQLRRLPVDWQWTPPSAPLVWQGRGSPGIRQAEVDRQPPLLLDHSFHRRGGSLESRARGTTLHALLERAAELLAAHPDATLRGEDPRWRNAAAALLHHHGIDRATHAPLVQQVLAAFNAVLNDPAGRWLLAAQRDARSEAAWSTRAAGGLLRTLRADRVFLAGPTPGILRSGDPVSEVPAIGDPDAGRGYLWIVDYKTAPPPPPMMLANFLAEERERHRAQMERYSVALRQVFGPAQPQRLALYYPLLPHLDWWGVED
jgi:ATP-dependent helicase/nuclease subunit A